VACSGYGHTAVQCNLWTVCVEQQASNDPQVTLQFKNLMRVISLWFTETNVQLRYFSQPADVAPPDGNSEALYVPYTSTQL